MSETYAKDINIGVKFQRKIYLGLVKFIDYIGKYIWDRKGRYEDEYKDVIELQLYDEIFEEIYIKYNGHGDMFIDLLYHYL